MIRSNPFQVCDVDEEAGAAVSDLRGRQLQRRLRGSARPRRRRPPPGLLPRRTPGGRARRQRDARRVSTPENRFVGRKTGLSRDRRFITISVLS